MSFKSGSSNASDLGATNFTPQQQQQIHGDIIRCGLLKKMKTARKKWFVLRGETPDTLARLEYYDSEKKFRSGLPPKRCIPLKTCFNINKRCDTKYKNVIALYTKDDCFCVVLDCEEELDSWLKDLLTLQHGEEIPEGQTPRPKFEYVWQVHVCGRGLGAGRVGRYRLCLTDKTLTLVRLEDEYAIELQLASIRSCGNLKNFFFLEIGRSSQLGAGELWIEADDSNIAYNIQTTVYHRFKICRDQLAKGDGKDDIKPEVRIRSSSATESSKPTAKRYIFSAASKSHIFPQDNPHSGTEMALTPTITTATSTSSCNTGFRKRCDSMPSRSRTTSEGNHTLPMWAKPYLVPHRPHIRDVSHSPPTGSPISPPSDSTGSSYSLQDENDLGPEQDSQRVCSIPLTPDEAIAEEDCPDSPYGNSNDYVPMALNHNTADVYQEMSPRGVYTAASNSASMSSVTSGTPSTDLKFCDYPLDKVISYFSTEEDDTRPARSFSVGSKPPGTLVRRVEPSGTVENSRVRAFSVGAKTKEVLHRVLPPHHPQPGIKSSSAPILSNNARMHSSHSSIGPMDDLMEMDFSSRTRNYANTSAYIDMRNNRANGHLPNRTPAGYVKMKPGVEPSVRTTSASDVSPYVDMSQGQRNSYVDMTVGNTNNNAYMDMSGSSPLRNSIISPSEDVSVDIHRQYHRNSTVSDYMDMGGQKRNRTNSGSSFTRPATSPVYPWPNDYMDMSGGSRRTDRNSFSSQISSSPKGHSTSPKTSDYMPLSFNNHSDRIPEVPSQTPEGYVEMTPGVNRHQRQSSLDSGSASGNEEYLSMSGAIKKTEKKILKKEAARSQPITILTTSNNQATKNSSPISINSILGRKNSTGTPPRMHLPLSSWSSSPYSSLPRQKNRKNSSPKDSSSSSVTTTPSSSSTMFPLSLNSPCSPPSKTTTPVGLKIPASILNAVYKPNKKSKEDVRTRESGYTFMDFENINKNTNSTPEDTSEYVNYCPAQSTNKIPVKQVVPVKNQMHSSGMDDYAMMKPNSVASVKSATLPLSKNMGTTSTSSLVSHLSHVGLNDPKSCAVFKPIREKEDRLGTTSKPDDQISYRLMEDATVHKQVKMEVDSSPYETLLAGDLSKITRPNSSNSDKIKSTSPRPSIDKMSSRPPSVCSDSKLPTSRPGSTSSVYSCSSISTVVSNSRPESVNGDRVVQLHYASLDLASADEDAIPKNVKNASSEANLMQCEPTFVYAEIDFIKSEGLKNNSSTASGSLTSNTKVN